MIGMLSLAAWGADTWFVPDRSHADALEDALAAQWPGRRAEVVVGPAPADVLGARWDGLELVVVADDQVRAAPAESAVDAVLLARTWTVPADPLLGEDLYLPEPLPEPPAEEVVGEAERGPVREVDLGVGLRQSFPSPDSGLRVVAGYTHGRNRYELVGNLPVGTAWQVETFGNPNDDGEVRADRATLGLLFGRVWPLSGRWARRASWVDGAEYRFAVGPELGWSERWRERPLRWTRQGVFESSVLVGHGVSADLGPVDLVFGQVLRLAPAGPYVDHAQTLDVRFPL